LTRCAAGRATTSLSGGAGDDYVPATAATTPKPAGRAGPVPHSQDAGIDKVLDFHLPEGDR